jgi:uncharacterized membrane protein
MPLSTTILLCLHALAAAFWVGGMAVMHFAVRPAAVAQLEPPLRLAFMAAALARFLAGVALAIAVLLASGAAMIAQAGGLAKVHVGVHVMLVIGLAMIALFGVVRVGPYPRLQRAVAASDWPSAARQLAAVRRLVAVNLLLGVMVFVAAFAGRLA